VPGIVTMQSIWSFLCGIVLLGMFCIDVSRAQLPTGASKVPTIRVNSRLVFLDVTVLDKKGHIVVKGLTKDDFSITEEKQLQRVFSFETPRAHLPDSNAADDNPAGRAPLTILVLDLLNASFEDFAYISYSVRKYLTAPPERLRSPAELMVLGNESLEMVQGYTSNKEDLLYALDHVPASLPYKMMNGAFYPERFGQSIDALQQIALQNEGVPGRKNIVWVGHGGPGIYTEALVGPVVDELNQYARDTTNMLVNARISLFVIYPGLPAHGPAFTLSAGSAAIDIGDNDDPFAGDINYGVFVNETGGKLFYNRNDVDREIERSQDLGSEYYTLTYQPADGNADGKFRRIRVTLRDPNLHAVTKAGYFAPAKGKPVDPRQQTMVNLVEAARSTIPFQALNLSIEDVVRHPDTRSVGLTLLLKPGQSDWDATDDGKSTTSLTLAAVSLAGARNILASKEETLTVTANTQDGASLAEMPTRLPVTIRFPRKAQTVRVVIQIAESQRIGTAELDRKTIDAAPEAPTQEPMLIPRLQKQETPATPPG
jgi:VWFA-related protein